MNRVSKILAALCFALPATGWSATGYEGFNIAPSFFYKTQKNKSNDSVVSEETIKTFSLRIGPTLAGGFYLGGIYEHQVTDQGSSELKDTNLGASVGFTHKGSYIVLHYFPKSTKDLNRATELRGKGFGLDMGYQFSMTSVFSLGAQLAYRSLEFDESHTSNGSTDTDFKYTQLVPMISLGFTL